MSRRWGPPDRAGSSAGIESWSLYDGPLTVADVAPKLARHEVFHNNWRPHKAFGLPDAHE